MVGDRQQRVLAQEAARILCVERLTDYGAAKRRAAQQLGLGARAPLPDNAQVQRAVIEYQELFGGDGYRRLLRELRTVALRAMTLLDPFSPRLVGGAVSGAVHEAHRVQLHVFAERPESVEIFLHDRGIACAQAERRYRYADGREIPQPLVRFDAGDTGIDAAVFPTEALHRPPLDPADGRLYRRLDLAAARQLAGDSAA